MNEAAEDREKDIFSCGFNGCDNPSNPHNIVEGHIETLGGRLVTARLTICDECLAKLVRGSVLWPTH